MAEFIPAAPAPAPNDSSTLPFARALGRRSFLRYTGAAAVVSGLALAGCSDDDDDTPNPNDNLTLTLARTDVGVLNYAYALEQLEAAFYSQVANGSAFTGPDLDRIKAIRDHEIAHREFFKKLLGNDRIKDLEVDFSSINLNDRTAVLAAARQFEDLGVAAYNGAGNLLIRADYLTVAGKIVSVEARHAAMIRDMIVANSFASRMTMGAVPAALDPTTAMDMALKPSQVLPQAATYIKSSTTLINQLP